METALAVAAGGAAVGGAVMQYNNANQSQKAARSAAVATQNAANENAAFELQQYEAERKAAALQSAQEVAAQQKDVNAAVSNITAYRAGAGLTMDSGTGRALLDETLRAGAADLETLTANGGRIQERIRMGETASVARARVANDQANRQAQNASIAAAGQRGAAIFNGIRGIASAGSSIMSRSTP